MRTLPALLTSALVLAAGFASAEEAHVHGEGKMEMVVDQRGALMTLEMPAVDLVGFERQPANDEETATVEAALETLRTFDAIFEVPAKADCRVMQSSVEFEVEEEDSGAVHAEFHVEYDLHCAEAGAFTSISTQLFQLYPNLEGIDLAVLSTAGQDAKELSSEHNSFKF